MGNKSGSRLRSLRFVCWGAALLLGGFNCCYRPFALRPAGPCDDAVSYLNLAAAYARGDGAHALSAYWSPLYSWLLALAFRLLHPSAMAEFPAAHLVNLIIFVAALACFDFFWRTWLEDHHARTVAVPTGGLSLPPAALLAIAFTLFTWSSIRQIGVQLMTPDLLVAAVVYLAAGLTLRLRRGGGRRRTAALLGGVLGLGFLAKAVMLPLAVAFLLVAIPPARNPRRAGLFLLSAAITFVIVIAPFVFALSCQQGHLTFGDAGRLNYAWFVNGAPRFNWRGEPPGSGKPVHPTRLLSAVPPVYEFASPIGGTYPVWTDPSYWNAGLRPRFSGRQQVRAVLKNLQLCSYGFHWSEQSGLMVGVFMLLFASGLMAKQRWAALVRWDLLLLALTPAVLYGLVVVESRYLGAYIVLFWLALLPAIRLPANTASKVVFVSAALAMLLPLTYGVGRASARCLLHPAAGDIDWDTATGMQAMGLLAGDQVSCIGLSCDHGWALMAGVRVVAEIPTDSEGEYWGGSPRVRAAVLGAFSKAGARAVIAEQLPAGSAASGWHRLGATDRYVHLLAPPPPTDSPASALAVPSGLQRASRLAIPDFSTPNAAGAGE